MSHRSSNSLSLRGFTLVEIIVTVSIMAFILGTVVMSRSNYNTGVSLENTTSDFAIAVRQSQVYGTSVKEVTPGSSEFSIPYGVALNLLYANSSFVSFVDRNQNGQYGDAWSCPAGGECLQATALTGGNYVSSICWIKITGTDNCTVSRVDITFVRPYTDARFSVFDSSGNFLITSNNIKGVRVIFAGAGGASKAVTVYTSGQIGIQ